MLCFSVTWWIVLVPISCGATICQQCVDKLPFNVSKKILLLPRAPFKTGTRQCVFPRAQATVGHKSEGLDGEEHSACAEFCLAWLGSLPICAKFTTSCCELKPTQSIPLLGTAPGKGLFHLLEPDQWAQGRCSGPGPAAVGMPLVPGPEQSTGRDKWTVTTWRSLRWSVQWGWGKEWLLGVPGCLSGAWHTGCSYQALEVAAGLAGWWS